MQAGPLSRLHLVRTVFANRDLRRVELAFIGFNSAEWATWIAILVFAYGVGGATEAGFVSLLQLVPAAITAPFVSLLGDRFPRARVLTGAYFLQALAMAAAGSALLMSAPLPLIYLFAALAATAITLTRPVQAALLPSLVQTPEELTAANVIAGAIEGASTFAAPALTGVLLAFTEPGIIFVVSAAALLWSMFFVSRIDPRSRPHIGGQADARGVLRSALKGFATLARDRNPRRLVGLVAARFAVVGAVDVLLVVLALRLLDIDEAGVGFLNAAEGFGGIAGSLAAILLLGRKRLAPGMISGTVLFGVSIATIGVLTTPVAAFALLCASGAGGTVVDVAGRTLLQRLADDDTLARVFGVLEGLSMGGLAIGSILGAWLVAAFGPHVAFVVAGAFLPALAAVCWRGLRQIDKAAVVPGPEIDFLRAIPMFAPLPPDTAERVASQLVSVQFGAGSVIFTQGSPGDRFYIVVEGEVRVLIDGKLVRSQTRGSYFGEIALVRGVPRTATVEAFTDTRLYALERTDFLYAITGYALSSQAAETVISEHLTPGSH